VRKGCAGCAKVAAGGDFHANTKAHGTGGSTGFVRGDDMRVEKGMLKTSRLQPDRLEMLLYGSPLCKSKRELHLESAGAIEAKNTLSKLRELSKKREVNMTVSLYKSMASGAMEVVVQTNAQSLDVFVGALADALHVALVHEASAPNSVDNSQALIAATLKNAFPVAFSIAGYKAEKVSESKLLTCGFASPDASELLAQSKT